MPILDTKVLTETEDSDLWEFEEELGSTGKIKQTSGTLWWESNTAMTPNSS